MKRKLIEYDVFKRIEKSSLSSAERELAEAEPVLANVMQVEALSLHCYGPEDVLYQTPDGSFVHANYSVQDHHVTFDNIEQLVINEDSEKQNSRQVIASMLDSLLEGNDQKASAQLSEYLSMPITRRLFKEEKIPFFVKKKDKDGDDEDKDEKKSPFGKKKGKFEFGKKGKKDKKDPDKKLGKLKKEKAKKVFGEWSRLCRNVSEYINMKTYGPVLRESVAKHDETGNVVAIRVPTIHVRNEAALKEFDWNTISTKCKMLRSGAKPIAEDINFCKAVAEIKRHNALSDDSALQEAIESVVSKWPQILYLTQNELASVVKEALSVANASNYDDTTCTFIAEGILRVAHNAYVDRVNKIMNLAGVQPCTDCDDKYAQFKETVDEFFPTLDESDQLGMQVFVDLYEAIRQVHVLAGQERNDKLQTEASERLDTLSAVIRQEIEPTTEIAQDAADWLEDLVETNLEMSGWSVSNTPHTTVQGDHPDMAKKARQGYAPASDFSGNWGDTAPVSDGKSYHNGLADEMRSKSWGNIGGNETYPELNNPYVPKPFGTYTMRGEKGVDKSGSGDMLSQTSNKDTWPDLQNPYVPKAVTPQSYKMKNGPETDLVVDK